jgi:hypothetical protein
MNVCGGSKADSFIRLEELARVDPDDLDRRMHRVPADQCDDIRLKRFLSFRLKGDGLVATQVSLSNQLSAAEQSAHRGRLNDFMCQDQSQSGDAQH